MPRCRKCVYVPDLDEWACEVCPDCLRPLAALRLLSRVRMGLAGEVAAEGDEFEDADFDADELGIDTDYPEDQ